LEWAADREPSRRRSGSARETAADDDGLLADIYVSYNPMDHQIARPIAAALADRGYTIAPAHLLDRNDNVPLNVRASDARCVIVLWTPPVLTDMRVQGDARSAGLRDRLIEVAFRKAVPELRYSDGALIAFPRPNNVMQTKEGRALVARVVELLGEGKKHSAAVVRPAPLMVFAAILAAIGGGVAYQSNGEDATTEQAHTPDWTAPANAELAEAVLATAKRPSTETPTADFLREAGAGGPKDYIAEDFGTDPKGMAPASADAKPPAFDRGVQGPDQ
jgi:hypothetical protein